MADDLAFGFAIFISALGDDRLLILWVLLVLWILWILLSIWVLRLVLAVLTLSSAAHQERRNDQYPRRTPQRALPSKTHIRNI